MIKRVNLVDYMEQKDFYEILRKYRLGQASPEEEKMIDDWYEAMGKQPGEAMDMPDEERERRYWENISVHVNWSGSRGKRHLQRYAIGVAASVCVTIVALFYLYTRESAQRTQAGGKDQVTEAGGRIRSTGNSTQQFTLPDGSRVTLSPHSSIRFPEHFNLPAREIYLEGEGFFEVVPDEKRPFLVHANDMTTKVLGTSFKVRAFQGDNKVTVAVRTGRVSVFRSHVSHNEKAVILTANQQVVYDRKEEKLYRQLVEAPQPLLPPAEIDRTHFEEAPLIDIFHALEKIYGVDIVFDETIFSSCTLTTSISGNDLYRRLDIICSAIGATYTLEENRIIVRGKGCN